VADVPFFDVLAAIQKQYPGYIALLGQHPELWTILRNAIYGDPSDPSDGGNWSKDRLQAAIAGIPYYQSTPQTTRIWDVLYATDPATARQKVQDAGLLVQQAQERLGIVIDSGSAVMIALAGASQGWDATRIAHEVVANSNGETTRIGPGTIGDTMTQYTGLAGQYGVPLDHNTAYWWAANTQAGNVTQEGFRDYVKQQAEGLYPALKGPLDQGLTVAQYASPYFQLAAQELGINPNQITLTDPKWMDLVLGTDTKGNQGVNSMTEALSKIRSDPTYGYDAGAPGKAQASQFATTLLKQFGATG
jgi:hypothetical protein